MEKNSTPTIEALDTVLQDTENIRNAFQGSLWSKFRTYPPRLFFDRFLQHYVHVGGGKVVQNKLFWGRNFYTKGYFLDYYLCGCITAPIELSLTKFLIRTVQQDTVFFDVGAHYGFFSVLAATLIQNARGAGGVTSFEPTPETGELLQKNVEGLPATVVRKAVTRATGESSFAIFKDVHEQASNSLYAEESAAVIGSKRLDSIRVSTVSLDEYCMSTGVWPTLVKLDVEGAEMDVLAGAERLLQRSPVLVLEVWPAGHNELHKRAIQHLLDQSYQLFALTAEGEVEPLTYEAAEKFQEPTNVVLKKG